MRVLVVGTVPPARIESSRPLGKAVTGLLDGGHDVEIWSPDGRSAAHRFAELDDLRLAWSLWKASRRFDALVLGLETRLPLRHDAGRLERAAVLAGLAASLRRFSDVTIRPVSPIAMPGGLGGRPALAVWSRAQQIVVTTEKDRDDLLAVPGIDAGRVVYEEPPGRRAEEWSEGWALGGAPTREAVLRLVRVRADRDRSIAGAAPPWYLAPGGAVAPRPRPSARAVLRIGVGRMRRLARRAGRRVRALV
ncbi:MAG TPA: hypothetical protein VMD59_16535 [Acidimicrobiales bacterium]|nr:hypothetical protein [Acidimicrobiales bacterium]